MRRAGFFGAGAAVMLACAPASAQHEHGGAATLSGVYQIDNYFVHFLTNGDYAVYSNGSGVMVLGAFTLDGDELVMTDRVGTMACEGVPGRYHVHVGEDSLGLTLIEDGCAGRAEIFQRLGVLPSYEVMPPFLLDDYPLTDNAEDRG